MRLSAREILARQSRLVAMMKLFPTCVERGALLVIILMFSDSQLQGLLCVYDIC